MTDSSRRRRRRITSVGSGEETKPIWREEEWAEEEVSETHVQKEKKSHWVMRKDIDQIKAELLEERSSGLIESEYWDETHSWGMDEEEVSDEYWHFLGRYE